MSLTVNELPTTIASGATGVHRSPYHIEIHQRLGGAGFYSPPPPLGSGSDDRTRLINWLATAPANCTVGIQHGYLVSAPLPLPSGRRYLGRGVGENDPAHLKLMNGANPAAATTAVVVAKEWDDNTTTGGLPTIFENLNIDGNAANNTGTYSCLLPFSYWTRVVGCRLDSPRLHHLLLTKLMKNGSASSIDHADNRIVGNRFRNSLAGTDGAGVRHLSAGGNNNMDVRCYDNHFEAVQHGIWSDDAAGWTIMDNHLWSRRNAINIDSGFLATQVVHNYVDGFGNENQAGSTYYGIRVRGFNGNGCTVSGNNVDITENLFTATLYCYALEAQNAGAHIAGGLNRAYGHATPNAAHHGFLYTANNGTVIIGQVGNVAVGFVNGQDFEQSTSGGGVLSLPYPRRPVTDAERLNGLKAWAYDPNAGPSNGAALQGSGRVLAVKVPLDGPTLVTNIILEVFTAGVTLTAGQNLACLYDSAGAKIATTTTADQSTAWTTTGTKVMAISGGPTWVDPGVAGWVWVGILTVGTTPPAWRRGNNNAQGVSNVGTTTTTRRFGLDASTGNTALPANLTPATMTAYEGVWAALS